MARTYIRGLQETIAKYLEGNQPAKTAEIAAAIGSSPVKVSRTLQILASNRRVKMLQYKEWVLTGKDTRKPLMQDLVLATIKATALTLKTIAAKLTITNEQTRRALLRLKFAGLAIYDRQTKLWQATT